MSKRGLYIAVCGVIGVGKTTLSKALAKELDAEFVPEKFEDNPYLKKFYEPNGVENFGFQTETVFLLQRANQAEEIESLLSQGISVVTDFTVYQNLIFSRITLSPLDYVTYCDLFDKVMINAPQPDCLVCLDADLNVIMNRIKGRGREMEADIDREYIKSLQEGYSTWKTNPPAHSIWIDTSERAIPYCEESKLYAIEQVKNVLFAQTASRESKKYLACIC